MNPAVYVAIFLPLLIILMQNRQQEQATKRLHMKKGKDRPKMKEIATAFIGKECLIYTVSSQLTGTVTQVTDGALMLSNKGTAEAVNLDYIVRIREYPLDKHGKKKSVILD